MKEQGTKLWDVFGFKKTVMALIAAGAVQWVSAQTLEKMDTTPLASDVVSSEKLTNKKINEILIPTLWQDLEVSSGNYSATPLSSGVNLSANYTNQQSKVDVEFQAALDNVKDSRLKIAYSYLFAGAKSGLWLGAEASPVLKKMGIAVTQKHKTDILNYQQVN